jgi:hypothetical protein
MTPGGGVMERAGGALGGSCMFCWPPLVDRRCLGFAPRRVEAFTDQIR